MKLHRRIAIIVVLFMIAAYVFSSVKFVSYADQAETSNTYLPLIKKDPTPTPTQTPTPTNTPMPTNTPAPTNIPMPTNTPVPISGLRNGSFEEGWTDMPPAPGYVINQQPNHWQLTWTEIGQPIFDSGVVANGVPEIIHKLESQLPPNERPGGSDPLILDGITTYKIFHYAASFGVELKQVVTGLTPGAYYRLTAPIRIHINGSDPDPWGAESGVWVNGQGNWANQAVMGDRQWYVHQVDFVVPASGEVTVIIRVKNKYNIGKDFFVDNIELETISP